MPAIRFVFVTWGFWALFDLRRRVPFPLVAVLCMILLSMGGTMLYLGENTGFGVLVLGWMLYAVTGACFWASLGGDLDEPFPKSLRTYPFSL